VRGDIPVEKNLGDKQHVLQQPRITVCQVPQGNAIPHQELTILHYLCTHLVPGKFRQECHTTSYVSRHKPTLQDLLTVFSDKKVPGTAMRQQQEVFCGISLMQDHRIGGESSLFGSLQNRREGFCTETVEKL
jgi:hypothetical protein